MNIFVDTSVLYPDPFWKTNFYRELLDIITEKKVSLFMSNVVLMELEHNYKKIIEQEIVKLDKVSTQIDLYNIKSEPQPTIDIGESIKNFNKFYEDLVARGIIKILEYSNDMLPEIVSRAIIRKKPFTENKTELKDTIIWLTYAEYVEENNSQNCILLTNNITDFCDTEKAKNKIFEIHPELQQDTSKFKVYKTPKEIIQSEKKTLQFISQRFSVWLDEQDFSTEAILNLLIDNFEKEIIRKIEREYESIEPSDIFHNGDYYVTGFVSSGFYDIFEVDEVQVDNFNEQCIISGSVYISCEVEAYEYISVRDPGEDSQRFYGETTNIVLVNFSFYYDQTEIPTSINLDGFEIAQ